MRIFHIATVADWQAAQASGSYTTSTLGRTLAEEGFIHASRGDQWQGVRDRFYGDVTEPLVLLSIDPDRLRSPVVDEVPDGASESFPHIYGPVNVDAVVSTVPLDDDAPAAPTGESFSSLFLREMFRNVLLASIVLVLVVTGAVGIRAVEPQWGALLGTVAGLAVGVPLVVWLHRRWD